MIRQKNKIPSYIYLKLMSLKRLWIMKPRSIRPVLLALAILAFTLMCNSLLLIGRRRPPQAYPEELLMAAGPPVAPEWPQPPVLSHSTKSVQPSTPQYWSLKSQVKSQEKTKSSLSFNKDYSQKEGGGNTQGSKNSRTEAVFSDFFDPLKGKVVQKKTKQKEKEPQRVGSSTLSKKKKTNAKENISVDTSRETNPYRTKIENPKGNIEPENHSKKEPTFGFVNHDFKPPDLSSSSLVNLKGLMDNFNKGENGFNLGSLIGAVVGLKKTLIENVKSVSTLDQEKNVKSDPTNNKEDYSNRELNISSEQSDIKSHEASIASSNLGSKGADQSDNQSSIGRETLSSREMIKGSSERHGRRPNGRFEGRQNAFGSLMSQLGPSLLSAAFTNTDEKDSQGSNASPLMSIVNGLGPVLMSGVLGQGLGASDARGSSHTGNANPMFSFITKMGSSLLANGMSSGSRGKNRESQNSGDSLKQNLFQSLASVMGSGMSLGKQNPNESPIQSLLSGLGPALIGSAVQNMLGSPKTGSGTSKDNKNSSPVQSIISGLAPVLLAGALSQGIGSGLGKSNTKKSTSAADSSPLQSLVSGLGPALLAGAMGQSIGGGLSGKSNGNSKGIGGLLADMAPLLMGGGGGGGPGIPRIRGNREPRKEGQHSDSVGGDHSLNHSSDESSKDKKKNVVEVHALTNDITHDSDEKVERTRSGDTPGDGDSSGGIVGGIVSEWLAKSLAKKLVGDFLPDKIRVPEANSTKGFWDMAFNVALGNPKEEKGRKSQFWSWLREYGAEDGTSNTNSNRPVPSWITEGLENPRRSSHSSQIQQLYGAITEPQPICQRMAAIGGTFNWKMNQMENERAVCFDSDVTPRNKDCLVYSFGFEDDWSFEEGMEKMGCEVWVFDPSEFMGNHNHSSHIHFYNVGLSDQNRTITTEVNEKVISHFTLPSILGHLGHERSSITYLTLDLGDKAWQVLQRITDDTPQVLANVKQLNLEVHLDQALKDPLLYKKYLQVLLTLESLGFQLFSSQAKHRKDNFFFMDPLIGEKVSLIYQLVYLRI